MEITFRGWQGHFICPCAWHLNTLICHEANRIVISTVGQYVPSYMGKTGYGIEGKEGEDRWCNIGYENKYETYVFYSDLSEHDDIDTSRQLCRFTKYYNDAASAQQGHYSIIEEVVKWLGGEHA